jgi:HlyD family secretion protein
LVLKAPVSGLVQMGGPSPVGANGNMAALAAAASGGSSLSSGSQPGGAGADPAPAVGAKVAAGTTVLTVVDVAELGLLAAVDETDVLLVTPGQSASVELDAAPGAQYRGTVRSVDVLPSASSGDVVSYRVRLTLSAGTQPDGSAAPTPRPGMSAVAHLEVRSATNAVVVPAPAVFRADGQDAVWAVRGGKAQRVAVTVGVPGQGLVEIVSGLSEGERVVIRGTDRVRSGQMMP